MPFTEVVPALTPLGDLAQILTGFGLITVLLAVLKRNSERRCWRHFKQRVNDWVDRLSEAEPRHLSDEEWMAECERMLTDSKFSPMEITSILKTAVIVAKGIAAERIFV